MLHIWSMNLRHAGVARSGVKMLFPVQFASLNRQWRGKERDRFGEFCTPKRVPNVQHIWRPKMFQTCWLAFGSCTFLTVSLNFKCTFGTILDSKCAAHLEHESATRVAGSKQVKI